MQFRLLFLLLLSTIAFQSMGSKAPQDTLLAPNDVRWFNAGQLEDPFGFTPQKIDTTITGFQLYDFAHRSKRFFAHRGNVGHATRKLKFNPFPGYYFRPAAGNLFDGYHFDPQNVPFYQLRHVYSELFYVMGADNEQLFYAMHNQRLNENLTAGAKYQVVNAPGSYNHLASRHSNVRFSLHYRLPGDRYQVLGSFISNRNQLQESGGLENRLDFEANPNMDVVLMPSATSQTRETIVNIHQFYQTGFFLNRPGQENTTDQQFLNLGRLTHEFSWRSQSLVFNDPSAPLSIFPTPPTNATFTFDSTRIHIVENRIGWSNFPLTTGRGRFPFNFRVFLKHSFIDIRQPLTVSPEKEVLFDRQRFSQIVQGAEVESDQNRFLSGTAYANYTLGGYHEGDVSMGTSLVVGRPQQNYRLRLRADLHNVEAPFFLSRFSSNYISWNNDFSKQTISRAGMQLQSNWFSAGVNYFLLNNMVYVGPQGLPMQNPNTFGMLQASLDFNTRLGPFRTRHNILFQYTAETQFEQFPEWVSYHSAFFDFPLFSRALFVNVGFDVQFNSAYQPMGYLPMIRQFYAQNQFTANHLVVANAFATFDIQRTRLFLMAQNIGALLPESPVLYHIPFYPLPGMAIKFGVSWKFFD